MPRFTFVPCLRLTLLGIALALVGCGGSSSGGTDGPSDATGRSDANGGSGGTSGTGGTPATGGAPGTGGAGGAGGAQDAAQADTGTDAPGDAGMGVDAPFADAPDPDGATPADGGTSDDMGTVTACPEGTRCQVGGAAGICRTGACEACTDTTDDAACQTAYGAGHICVAGACVPGTCRTAADCSGGQVCKNRSCAACVDMTDDALCGAGKLCVGGACVTGTCRDNAGCMGGMLCKSNTCQACSDPGDDQACTARYGAGFICNAGQCVAGCRTQSDCSGGQVCKNAVCSDCAAGDGALCAERYGMTSACESGKCTMGMCAADTGCGGGTVCNTMACGACADSADDGRCQTRYGAGTLCIGGSCVTANCRDDAACMGGQLCKSNTCAACVDTTDDGACAARYGAGFICNGGACVAGCGGDAACMGGQLCKSNACAACADTTDDGACAARYGAGFICNGGMCVAGCRDDAACMGGQLCKMNTCQACADPADDAACSTRYGLGQICNAGTCGAGCRTAQACTGADADELCTALTCTACTEDAAGDTACATQYAQARVCVGGKCVAGNCRTSADCTGANAGQLCVSNQCTPCANNAGCQADATYGAATICHTAAGAQQGQCVSSSCTMVNFPCSANPSVNFCCTAPGAGGNACITGNCCTTSQCGAGQICQKNQCVLCDPPQNGEVYVDPASGEDSIVATGSATCPWRSITYALNRLTSHSGASATIHVKATAALSTATGETFPIGVLTNLPGIGNQRVVPANRIIRGAGTDRPTILVPTNQRGFQLFHAGSRLTQLVIDSADNSMTTTRGGYGVFAYQGTDATTTVDHVTIQNMRFNGIQVTRWGSSATAGVLTIGPGTRVTGNGSHGLVVSGNGKVTINGGTDAADGVLFTNNTGYGIYVNELGSVTATGTAPYPVPAGAAESTVLLKNNSSGGMIVEQCVSRPSEYTPTNGGPTPPMDPDGNCGSFLSGLGAAPPTNTLDGVAAWGNTQNNGNGIVVRAGSALKLRNSLVLANGRAGVLITDGPSFNETNPGGDPANFNYRVFELSGIDLGTAGDPGRNVLQVPWGATSPVNGGAGVQLAISSGQAKTLSAVGNRFSDDATLSMLIDCATTATTISRNYPNITTCFSGNPSRGVSVCGNLTGTNANGINVAMCTIP